jgi:hypothetical protein
MAMNKVPDVPKTYHYLSFETLLHLELGCEAYNCSNKALLTNIVAMYWDLKRDEILEKVSEQTYMHIQEKLLKKFGGVVGELKG